MTKAMIVEPISPDQKLFWLSSSGRHTFLYISDVVEMKTEMTCQSPKTKTRLLRPVDKQSDPQTYNSPLRRCGGRGMGNNRNEDEPLASYWRFRTWLPDDRHEQEETGQPRRRGTSPAEATLKNVERGFKYSLTEYGEVYSKMLDEILRNWDKKGDDGSWRAQRRLWEAYESVMPTGDHEEIGNRLGMVLAYLKKHYRSRLLDHQKRRKRIDWGFTTPCEGDGDDKEPDKPNSIEQIPHGGPDVGESVASAAHFEAFRELVRLHYTGPRIDELIAVINAIENGAWKRRDVAAAAGVDEKRLAAILRTLRKLGKRYWRMDSDSTHLDEVIDNLDDDTKPPTDDEDSE